VFDQQPHCLGVAYGTVQSCGASGEAFARERRILL
jgi:hypothetical protein